MWRPARGTGLQGPGEGQRALPCGMRSGLLCAVLCIPGTCAHCSTPSSLLPSFPSCPSPPTSLWAPARDPGRCLAAPWNVFLCVPLE